MWSGPCRAPWPRSAIRSASTCRATARPSSPMPATVVRSVTVPFDDEYRFASVVTGGSQGGVRFYFVEYPPYFDRDALYGTPAGDYPDNAERFALFSRTVLEASKILGVPQIFHCHDWQSALVPVLLRTDLCRGPRLPRGRHGFHHPQHGLPGIVPARHSAAAHAALGSFHHVEDGILRPGELPERRADLLRLHHHGEPQIQPGNSDRRIRIRPGRRSPRPRFHGDRNSQWRRLRRVEPADRQVHRRQIFAAGSRRQGQMQAGSAGRLRRRERRPETAGDRNRLPLRRAKGFRPDRAGLPIDWPAKR